MFIDFQHIHPSFRGRSGLVGVLASLCLGCLLLSCEGTKDDPSDSGRALKTSAARMALRPQGAGSVRQAATLRSSGTPTVSTLQEMYVTVSRGTAGSESLVFQNELFFWDGHRFLGERDWPASGTQYRFYASSVPMEFRSGGTVLWADGTTDVGCAYSGSPVWGAVNVMSFEHVFGRIGRVTLLAESGWSISDVSVTVEAVTGGTYDIRGGKGHDDRTGWSELVTESACPIAPASPGTADLGLYLVPGTYQLTARWTATAGGVTQSYQDMSASVTVVAGRSSDVTLTLGGKPELSVSVSLSAWDGSASVNYEI